MTTKLLIIMTSEDKKFNLETYMIPSKFLVKILLNASSTS